MFFFKIALFFFCVTFSSANCPNEYVVLAYVERAATTNPRISTGIVISQEWVLTAASFGTKEVDEGTYLIEKPIIPPYMAQSRKLNISQIAGRRVRVTSVFQYPHRQQLDPLHRLSILRSKSALTVAAAVFSVEPNVALIAAHNRETLQLQGFGGAPKLRVDEIKKELSEPRFGAKCATLQAVNMSLCLQNIASIKGVQDAQKYFFCAKPITGDRCIYDDGGPIYRQNDSKVIGLTTNLGIGSNGCNGNNTYSVFIRIEFYLRFISFITGLPVEYPLDYHAVTIIPGNPFNNTDRDYPLSYEEQLGNMTIAKGGGASLSTDFMWTCLAAFSQIIVIYCIAL